MSLTIQYVLAGQKLQALQGTKQVLSTCYPLIPTSSLPPSTATSCCHCYHHCFYLEGNHVFAKDTGYAWHILGSASVSCRLGCSQKTLLWWRATVAQEEFRVCRWLVGADSFLSSVPVIVLHNVHPVQGQAPWACLSISPACPRGRGMRNRTVQCHVHCS